MTTFLQDLRFAVRALRHRTAPTTVVILTLALGLGASIAVFTVVNAVLLRPLPFADPGRLVLVWERNFVRDRRTNVVGPANYLEWRDQNRVFSSMAAVAETRVTLTGAGDPEEVGTFLVNASLFPALGVTALHGRTFVADEDAPGRNQVVVLGHEIWQRRFGGDPAIVGQSIRLNATAHQVVGVLRPGFSLLGRHADVFLPIGFSEAAREPRGRSLAVLARLKPGVDLEQAQAGMEAVSARLVARWPAFNTGWGVNVVPLQEQMAGPLRPALVVLLAAVLFVLLIACANVANLFLATGLARQRELAIRSTLGASRWRIVRQLAAESVLVAGAGGLMGLAVGFGGIRWLVASFGDDLGLRGVIDPRMDLRLVVFAVAVSLAAAIVAGLVPAIAASRDAVSSALREAGRAVSESVARRRAKRALVVGEIGLALILLAAAGVMLKSFDRLLAVVPGFSPQGVLTFSISVPADVFSAGRERVDQERERAAGLFRTLTERLEALPGVRAAGMVSFLPLTGLAAATSFTVVGRPNPPAGQEPVTDVRVVAGSYFRAMGIPLLRGRLFEDQDGTSGPSVVIVNQAMARQVFPGEDPIGRDLSVSWGERSASRIVGVVGDVKHDSLDGQVRPMIYWPVAQSPYRTMAIVLRTDGDPRNVLPPAVAEVHRLDPDIPVSRIRTLEEIVTSSVARPAFLLRLMTLFAALAILLAAVGIYGLLSHAVSRRTHEMGIRTAVGAARADILRLVMGESLLLAALGLALGLAGTSVLGRFLRALLFEVSATDPAVLAGVSLLLALVALLAAYLPARRAASVDPIRALRYQ